MHCASPTVRGGEGGEWKGEGGEEGGGGGGAGDRIVSSISS